MKRFFIIIFCLLSIAGLRAQTEGVSITATGSDPDTSAILDIQSTDKGLLIPRMTTSERDAISGPADGLMIYNTEDSAFNYYTGIEWIQPGSVWKQRGDTLYYDRGMVGIGTDTPMAKLNLAGGNFLHTPSDPIMIGSITDNGVNTGNRVADASSIYVIGKYAYITSNVYNAVTILDISDPTNPIHVGAISDDGTTRLRGPEDIFVSGKYAYVASFEDNAVEILDISDPTNPTHMGFIGDDNTTLLNEPIGIYVSGKYAYVASLGDDAVEILDISDPTNPTHVGAISDVGATALAGAQDIFVAGNYAYVTANYENGVEILDISDPANPTHAGAIFDDATTELIEPTGIYVSGSYAYVASYGGGVEILDISNPTSPTHVGAIADDTQTLLDGSWGIHVSGDYAYVTSYEEGSVAILDISDPTQPTQVASISDNPTENILLRGPFAIFVSSKYAYVTNPRNSNIAILDISGLAAPSASIGTIATNTLSVSENAQVGNDLSVGNGLIVGSGGIYSQADISSNGTFYGDGSGLTNLPSSADDLGNHTATQHLNLSGNNITNGGAITASAFVGDGSGLTNVPQDDLGDHTATQNIELSGNWLSNDGGNEGVRIDNDGNVGIGIASPDAVLHTSSTQTGTATGVRITQGSSNSLIYHTSDGDLVLRKLSESEQVVLDNSGNVGINTTGPTEQLDVNGNVRIRGGNPIIGQVLTATSTDGTATWANIPSSSISLQTKTPGTVSYTNADDWQEITNTVTIGTGSYQNGDVIKIEALSTLRLSAGSGTDLFDIRVKLEYPCQTVYTNLLGYGPDENGINHDNWQIIHYLDFIALSTTQCNGAINITLEVRNTGDDAWQARDRILFVTKL